MLTSLLVNLIELYSMIIVVYVLLSWLPTDRGILKDINHVLGTICDPYLDLFKRIIPPIGGFVDISPIFALLVLQFVTSLVVRLLGFAI